MGQRTRAPDPVNLYFLRHGPAFDQAEWSGTDFDRPLTKEGRRRMAREAEAFVRLALKLDVIVTSPLVRARETAEIVAVALKQTGALVVDDRVGLDFDVSRLAAILGDHRATNAVMLVGHEPGMSETIGRVVGAARVEMKKGGLAYVELPTPPSLVGTLVWLLAPKVLLL